MAFNPSQLDPLFHDSFGQISGIAAIFMVIAGFYVIRRIVRIEL
jgi:Flp pilus assembly protein TadB